MAFVADMVRIAKSLAMLTTGMERGPSFHIATLDLTNSPYALSEFSLVLSLFGVFSPDYKLLGEQCYWFVDVAIRAVRERSPTAVYTEGPQYSLAGTYGKIKIRQSAEVRTKLIQTFVALAAFDGLEKGADNVKWWNEKSHLIANTSHLLSPTPDADANASAELSAVATEIQRRATGALALITRGSAENQATMFEASVYPTLSALLRHSSEEIQQYAVVCITNIIQQLASLSPLKTADISLFLPLLKSTSVDTQLAAVDFLSTLAVGSPQAHLRVLEVGTIPALAPLVLSTSETLRLKSVLTMSRLLNPAAHAISSAQSEIICKIIGLITTPNKAKSPLMRTFTKLARRSNMDHNAITACSSVPFISTLLFESPLVTHKEAILAIEDSTYNRPDCLYDTNVMQLLVHLAVFDAPAATTQRDRESADPSVEWVDDEDGDTDITAGQLSSTRMNQDSMSTQRRAVGMIQLAITTVLEEKQRDVQEQACLLAFSGLNTLLSHPDPFAYSWANKLVKKIVTSHGLADPIFNIFLRARVPITVGSLISHPDQGIRLAAVDTILGIVESYHNMKALRQAQLRLPLCSLLATLLAQPTEPLQIKTLNAIRSLVSNTSATLMQVLSEAKVLAQLALLLTDGTDGVQIEVTELINQVITGLRKKRLDKYTFTAHPSFDVDDNPAPVVIQVFFESRIFSALGTLLLHSNHAVQKASLETIKSILKCREYPSDTLADALIKSQVLANLVLLLSQPDEEFQGPVRETVSKAIDTCKLESFLHTRLLETLTSILSTNDATPAQVWALGVIGGLVKARGSGKAAIAEAGVFKALGSLLSQATEEVQLLSLDLIRAMVTRSTDKKNPYCPYTI
jgi:hypothetical protein